MKEASEEGQEKTRLISINGAQLYYKMFGTGFKTMIAFHGYGQSCEHFQKLSNALKGQVRIISVGLFFHGESNWPLKDLPIQKKDWILLMKRLIQEEQLDRFSLTGFSMGGKFLLATFEAFPDRVDELIFIAPDGIKVNLWYRLATSQKHLRGYFRSIVTKPQRLFRLMKLMDKASLVNKRVLKFASSQMDTSKKRRRVYLSWTAFRLLKFDMNKISKLINMYRTKACFFLGKYDKIVTRKQIHPLIKRLDKYEVVVLDSGHSHLIEAVAKWIKKRN